MPANDEQAQLQDFVAARSELAFESLVERHIDLVFGCALRRTGDAGTAEEISQNVFTILARKAHRLKAGSGLAGWLHKTTIYESNKALRGESRRQRKMKALVEHTRTQNESAAADDAILPLVDEAIDELPENDRRVILLHYFDGCSFREISQAIGKSEAASQKQASRALGKLEKILRRRGVVATAAALGSILATESVKAAPAGIATTISGSAIAGASSLTTTTLITNAIQTMTYAKTKVALLVATVAAVPIGVQMNSITELKRDRQTYEEREVAFAERGERLTELEQRLAALDPNVKPGSGRTSALLTALHTRKDPGNGGATADGTKAGNREGTVGRGPGAEVEAVAETGGKPEAHPYAEMMNSPAMRSMVKKQMKAQIAVSYGDLLGYLEPDAEKREVLSEILLDRQMSAVGSNISKLPGGGGGKSDPAEIEKFITAFDEYNSKLKEALGEVRYEEFNRFEQSAAERMELATFKDVTEDKGIDLPYETEQKLMAIMYEERTTYVPSAHLNGGPDFDPSAITEEQIDAYFADQRTLQNKIRERVKGVLDGDQFQAFAQNQANYIKMLETSMKMQAKLFEPEE